MFRQNTTIVVGAGASCEIGLPSGDQLKRQIADLFATTDENSYGLQNKTMIEAVKGRLRQRNHIYVRNPVPGYDGQIIAIRDAAKRIRRGLPLALSIDNFLHAHQADAEVVRLGKVGIAMSILAAERRSAFFERVTPAAAQQMGNHGRRRPMTLTSKEMLDSWYVPFAQLLMSGIGRDAAADVFRNVRFVIFNYDRCLEQYLWLALQAYFDLPEADAAEIMAGVEFLHPYGSLGPLPWQVEEGGQPVPLGGGDGLDVWQVSSRIRTFTESVESEVEPRIRAAMSDAATILILGFGYLDQNVQLLTPGEKRVAHRIISSAYGVSQSDQLIIRDVMRVFARPSGSQIMLEPGTCRDVFNNHRLQLTLR